MRADAAKSSYGVTKAPVGGSFEIRAVSAGASVSDLPAGEQCPQSPLALSDSGWVCGDAARTGYLVGPASITADDVVAVDAGPNAMPGSTNWMVRVTLSAAGAKSLAELTRKVSQAKPPADELALVVDGRVLSAPHVRDTITGASVVVSLKGGEADAKAVEAVILGSAG